MKYYYSAQVNNLRRVVMGFRHIGQVEMLAPQSLQVFNAEKKEKHKHAKKESGANVGVIVRGNALTR